MGRIMKIAVTVLIIGFVASIVAMIMTVSAKRGGDMYRARMKIAFNATALRYEEGEVAATIIADINGETVEIDPDDYASVAYYLRAAALPMYFPRKTDSDNVIKLTFCGEDTAIVRRVNADMATVEFTTAGKTMKMRIKTDNLWDSLVKAIMPKPKAQ